MEEESWGAPVRGAEGRPLSPDGSVASAIMDRTLDRFMHDQAPVERAKGLLYRPQSMPNMRRPHDAGSSEAAEESDESEEVVVAVGAPFEDAADRNVERRDTCDDIDATLNRLETFLRGSDAQQSLRRAATARLAPAASRWKAASATSTARRRRKKKKKRRKSSAAGGRSAAARRPRPRTAAGDSSQSPYDTGTTTDASAADADRGWRRDPVARALRAAASNASDASCAAPAAKVASDTGPAPGAQQAAARAEGRAFFARLDRQMRLEAAESRALDFPVERPPRGATASAEDLKDGPHRPLASPRRVAPRTLPPIDAPGAKERPPKRPVTRLGALRSMSRSKSRSVSSLSESRSRSVAASEAACSASFGAEEPRASTGQGDGDGGGGGRGSGGAAARRGGAAASPRAWGLLRGLGRLLFRRPPVRRRRGSKVKPDQGAA